MSPLFTYETSREPFSSYHLSVILGILDTKEDSQKTWDGRKSVENLHGTDINNGHLFFTNIDGVNHS